MQGNLQRCRIVGRAASKALVAEADDRKGADGTRSEEAAAPHVPGATVSFWHNLPVVGVLQLRWGQLAPSHLRMHATRAPYICCSQLGH